MCNSISIDDDQGAITASIKATLRHRLAGALLAELALANKINLEEGRLANGFLQNTLVPVMAFHYSIVWIR